MGEKSNPNGYLYRPKDGARYVPADCWQMNSQAEQLVAVEKLVIEPEKIPYQTDIQFATEF